MKKLRFLKIFGEKRGFTLVELLVVVAIIGILSTLFTANFIGVRQRSRDSQRKSNLRQVQAGLELYRADQGSYPPALANCPTNSPTSLMSVDCTSSTYLQKIPTDPGGGSYTYTTNGTTYSLTACLENGNDSEKDSTNLNPPCNGTTGFSYTIKNP